MSTPPGLGIRGRLLLCRYQLVLAAKGGDSIFKIVETNDFKQLPHITLAFKPGNDMAIKQVCSKQATTCAAAILLLKAPNSATVPGFPPVRGEEQL